MTAQPAGPLVVVVGMHRSGTSAVTGALGALGLQMPRPRDRMPGGESNPEHWESLSLSLHDEGLLHALGGSWDAPPDRPRHWVHTAQVAGGFRSAGVLAAAYPEPVPSAVKDPRICLLLPHWRTVLAAPMVALLVWRAPLDVARSLLQRDGLPLASGLALWERYNRSALQGLVGADAYVTSYESVLAEPAASLTAWADWLGPLDGFDGYRSEWDADRAVAAIAPELRHQATTSDSGGRELLSAEQQDLLRRLEGLAGPHRPLPDLGLGEETPWATAVLAARREATRGAHQAEEDRRRFWALRERWGESRVELARAAADLRTARDERDGAHQERDGAHQERDGAHQERDGALESLAATRAALADAEDKLSQLYRSSSWRATKPLRAGLTKVEQWGRRSPGPGSGH